VARVGLLGGTFNPPHLAHLVCAQEALIGLGLDRVLLMPVGVPPHKVVEAEPGVAHRVAMCEAAVGADQRFGVSRADTEREGPSYTVDLLRSLDGKDDLTFIVGGDIALGLPSWHEPEAVLDLATLAVAERSGAGRHDVTERLEQAFPGRASLRFFDMPRMDVSSSQIRRRVAAGHSIRYLVPDPVVERIARERLYIT